MKGSRFKSLLWAKVEGKSAQPKGSRFKFLLSQSGRVEESSSKLKGTRFISLLWAKVEGKRTLD